MGVKNGQNKKKGSYGTYSKQPYFTFLEAIFLIGFLEVKKKP